MRDGEPTSYAGVTKDPLPPLPPDPAGIREAEIVRLLETEDRLQAEIARARVVKLSAEERMHVLGRQLYENRLAMQILVDER